MIPKMDHKINGSQSKATPRGKLEWLGLKLLDHHVKVIITTRSIINFASQKNFRKKEENL